MNRTKEELLIECITQLKHIDEINKNEPLATTTSLIREINQVLNLPVVTITEGKFCQECGKRKKMKGDGTLELLCEC